jgi:hypothetical protein
LVDNLKSIGAIIDPLVTALAVIVAGLWAYLRFMRGRTFRQRAEVTLLGQWHNVGKRYLLKVHITLKNVGSSKIVLRQEGTGLKVSTLSAHQKSVPGSVAWTPLEEVFRIFIFERPLDEWMEPGETISDEVLLDLCTCEPLITRLEARLEFKRFMGPPDQIFKRTIIPDQLANGRQGENQDDALQLEQR